MSEKKSEIDLLKESPVEHILGKLNDVLAACTTLKARIDVLEDHVVFLLSYSPEYKKFMEQHKNEKQQQQPV